MERRNRANETRAKEAENQTKQRERESEREREKGNRQDGSQMAPVDYLPSGHEDA